LKTQVEISIFIQVIRKNMTRWAPGYPGVYIRVKASNFEVTVIDRPYFETKVV